MIRFTYIRNGALNLLAALLVMTQSLFARGMSFPFAATEDIHGKKVELKEDFISKKNVVTFEINFMKVASRIHLAGFFFHRLAKIFIIDIAAIKYHNCKAFFINSHSFNVFYAYTSALAP